MTPEISENAAEDHLQDLIRERFSVFGDVHFFILYHDWKIIYINSLKLLIFLMMSGHLSKLIFFPHCLCQSSGFILP